MREKYLRGLGEGERRTWGSPKARDGELPSPVMNLTVNVLVKAWSMSASVIKPCSVATVTT